jgi:hypothetical protein
MRRMFDDLEAELAEWDKIGAVATFWWRDDDAVAATPALSRLVALSEAAAAPVAIAVIPQGLQPDLPRALAGRESVRIFQHGYAHRNHAPPGEKACELGLHRGKPMVLGELVDGRAALADAFGAAFAPVVAAPWNRIDRSLLPDFPGIGLRGVSTFRARERRAPAPGLVEANMHFDIVDWKAGRKFRGHAKASLGIVGLLRRRRTREVDPDEPTGILSHHLVLDEASWGFLDDFVRFIAAHRAASWSDPAAIFR